MEKFIKITVTENNIKIENNGLSNAEVIGTLEMTKQIIIRKPIEEAKTAAKGKKNARAKQ